MKKRMEAKIHDICRPNASKMLLFISHRVRIDNGVVGWLVGIQSLSLYSNENHSPKAYSTLCCFAIANWMRIPYFDFHLWWYRNLIQSFCWWIEFASLSHMCTIHTTNYLALIRCTFGLTSRHKVTPDDSERWIVGASMNLNTNATN